MMNPILNPGMYKCAIGYAGVYDISQDTAKKDNSKQYRAYWDRTRGDDATQGRAVSLTHIGQARRADPLITASPTVTSISSSSPMRRRRLQKSGKTFETFVKADEGHGFYKPEDQVEVYNRMKNFLLKYNPPN
jgi:hypothetical protein